MDPTPERQHAASTPRAYLDRGLQLEQAGALERALEMYRQVLAQDPSVTEQIEAHIRIARVHRAATAWGKSRAESSEAIQLAERVGADDLAAEAMNVEVGALQMRGSFDQADSLATRALELARSPRVRGIILQNLGRSAAERRDFETSDRYFSESVDAFRGAGYEIGLAVALTNAAKAALDRGDPHRSLEIGQEAIVLARRLNALDVLLTAVQNQAAAFVELGNLDDAELLLTEALGHFTSARNYLRQAECLEIMGQMSESGSGDHDTAIRCYSRARDLARGAGDQALYDRLTKRLETARGSRHGDNAATP